MRLTRDKLILKEAAAAITLEDIWVEGSQEVDTVELSTRATIRQLSARTLTRAVNAGMVTAAPSPMVIKKSEKILITMAEGDMEGNLQWL